MVGPVHAAHALSQARHALAFEPSSQNPGLVMVMDLGKIGIMESMRMFPPKVKNKLDKEEKKLATATATLIPAAQLFAGDKDEAGAAKFGAERTRTRTRASKSTM